MKKLSLLILSVLFFAGCGFLGFNAYEKYHLKNEVLYYLMNEKNIDENDIEKLDSFYSKLTGDKKYLVYVKIKGDDKQYYYYQDSKDKILLESYTLEGVSY